MNTMLKTCGSAVFFAALFWSGSASAADLGGTLTEALQSGSTATALGLIFMGGLATSLTGCVYPMIVITVSVFGARQAKSRWEGALLSTLLESATPKPDARFVFAECEDGYSTNMPLDVATDDDVLLAYRLNGDALPQQYGGPVRLVVPKKYAYKSAKWLRRIELLPEDRLGYWEQRGYSNTADPWTNDRRAPKE